ncbi:MAG TPA: choice-of-anchor Q domain-containing protein [Kofleriaceae bacterium]
MWAVIAAVLASCSVEATPGVCCISAQDCTSIGASDDSRPCPDGQVCKLSNHMCQLDECSIDDDCAAPTPYCAADMTCVGCRGDADCEASAPVCDPGTSSCRGCADDSECDSEVCDAQAGTCVDPVSALYASTSGSGTVCSQMTPCDLATAFDQATNARPTIKLAQGSYVGAYTLPGKTFDLHGSDSTLTGNVASTPTLSLGDYTSLTMSRITVQAYPDPQNTTSAINCVANEAYAPGSVALDQVTIQSVATALLMRQCNITIERSHVIGGSIGLLVQGGSEAIIDRTLFEQGVYSGLISASDSTVHATNSVFVSRDNATTNNFVLAASESLIDVSFSTIIGNPWTCSTASICDGTTPSGVCISNSVVMSTMAGTTNTLDDTCGVHYSIVYPQTGLVNGSHDKLVDPMLVDPANGDFHLMPGSPAVDAAEPGASDASDFEGTARPQGDADDMGAFELVPSGG